MDDIIGKPEPPHIPDVDLPCKICGSKLLGQHFFHPHDHEEPAQPEWSMVELIDGAYDIVEIWPALTPAQKIWKKKWMVCARQHGTHPSR